MTDSRAYTEEEIKEMFLDNIKFMIMYWDKVDTSSNKDKLEGLAQSILGMIDGVSGDFPCSLDLVARVYPDDKDYHIEEGENYIEDGCVINTESYLRQELFR